VTVGFGVATPIWDRMPSPVHSLLQERERNKARDEGQREERRVYSAGGRCLSPQCQ
jgi:hypothetical protein